ncbi:hypothetical protein J4408_03105 [Candidatus Pacearchaeota archaeon]|nr:hypothetical protein [Candidatus Pacearchaeota archaeon]
MKVEEHEKAYEEHKKNIDRAIEEGIENNQRNIGYNISQGSAELFAIFLHKLHKIQGSGDQIDHRIFKSDSLIKKKIPFDFPSKKEILDLMREIEEERNALCYGSRKPKERIEKAIKSFNALREVINKKLSKEEKDKNGKSK